MHFRQELANGSQLRIVKLNRFLKARNVHERRPSFIGRSYDKCESSVGPVMVEAYSGTCRLSKTPPFFGREICKFEANVWPSVGVLVADGCIVAQVSAIKTTCFVTLVRDAFPCDYLR